jgi:cellulose biosynthesis protein BcsQ
MSNGPEITVIYKGKGGVGGTTTANFLATAKALYNQALNRVRIPDRDMTAEELQELFAQMFNTKPGALQYPDQVVEDRTRVLLIDADKGTRSIDRYTARRAQTHDITERLPYVPDKWTPDKGILPEFIGNAYVQHGRPDEIVVDMGADPDYAHGAALMANCIIMPTKAWAADYDTLVDLKAYTDQNQKANAYVLLTMVDAPHKGEAAKARATIEDKIGLRVLETEIKKHGDYREAYDTGSTADPLYAYLSVLSEVEGYGPIKEDLNPGPNVRVNG